jgi:predicted helicase
MFEGFYNKEQKIVYFVAPYGSGHCSTHDVHKLLYETQFYKTLPKLAPFQVSLNNLDDFSWIGYNLDLELNEEDKEIVLQIMRKIAPIFLKYYKCIEKIKRQKEEKEMIARCQYYDNLKALNLPGYLFKDK